MSCNSLNSLNSLSPTMSHQRLCLRGFLCQNGINLRQFVAFDVKILINGDCTFPRNTLILQPEKISYEYYKETRRQGDKELQDICLWLHLTGVGVVLQLLELPVSLSPTMPHQRLCLRGFSCQNGINLRQFVAFDVKILINGDCIVRKNIVPLRPVLKGN